MNHIIYILLNTAKFTNFNWTVFGIIITAVPIIIMLCNVLIKFGRFSNKFEHMAEAIDIIGKNINKNSFTLKSVTTFLYTTGATPGLFENNSPISLTNTGKIVLEISGGKEYIDNHTDSLTKEMENENLSTALDVQNFSASLLFQKVENEDFSKIKSFVYNNPTYEKINITLATMINVMAIYLRDKYLEKYPNLLKK